MYFSTVEICVPCPKGTTCCGSVWGKCVCWHPVISSCCTHPPDPVCEAANAACIALKKPIEAALEAAKATLNTV